ncbi:hypothetical protein INS49_005372 [Diaporthe citri]|uniref:uncharacterized protein n=1 Tax=Diaporthe citri TaxID=83186 RepID=UPI001C81C476|nr:uncharacterized protein INS49_005372 [Diaporthe citri]KAG6353664.1 hypothetical protein INS49_005372 [Diaporthe citri]
MEDDGHDFEFVEGFLQCPMSPGVEALSLPNQSFYAFYDPDSLVTLHDAISRLHEYVLMEGPFDAVMGFSSGAVLAALYIAELQQQGKEVPFKCGIFLASADSAAEMRHLGLESQTEMIRIPTAHIWGSNDVTAPMGGKELSQICKVETRHTLVHDGVHEIPRKHNLTETVHAIRRTLGLVG